MSANIYPMKVLSFEESDLPIKIERIFVCISILLARALVGIPVN